ncbi:MAG: response regulator [Candidatus Moraniibacteriota bacterium]
MSDKKKILVVEDDMPIARALSLKLEKEGFEVKSAGSGEEGLKVIESDDFDLVLLDLIMPEKDGFYVLEQVRKRNLNVKIMVASNLSQPKDIKKAKKMGAVDYFVKSGTSIVEVVEKVKKNLE